MCIIVQGYDTDAGNPTLPGKQIHLIIRVRTDTLFTPELHIWKSQTGAICYQWFSINCHYFIYIRKKSLDLGAQAIICCNLAICGNSGFRNSGTESRDLPQKHD